MDTASDDEVEKKKSPHGRVYARGFYDGVLAASAGITTLGEKMNQARKESLVNGLSGVARKAYASVPISEGWTSQKIASEMNRVGISIDLKTLQGCLASLVAQGLINEPSRNLFIRTEIKKPTPSKPVVRLVEKANEPKAPAMTQTDTKASPLDLLAGICQHMEILQSSFNKLKSDTEAAAIAIEEQFEESEKRNVKLKQLQELLKNLG